MNLHNKGLRKRRWGVGEKKKKKSQTRAGEFSPGNAEKSLRSLQTVSEVAGKGRGF